jgi:segregation and condensation protein B
MGDNNISEEEVLNGVKVLFGDSSNLNTDGADSKKMDSVTSVSSTIEEIDIDKEADNSRKVEAALFISGRYLSIAELVTLTDVNPIILKKILSDLSDKYEDFGISVVRQGERWKMDVDEEHRDMVNKLASGSSEFSKAEQESLAIIAYKQPMRQSILVKIRGNKAYDHVKRFVEMGLLNKKRIGHTSELKLSDSFYEYFHLTKGEKLPELDEGSSRGE